MGDMDENSPSISILLPMCSELKPDVFLEILKSVVFHSRLNDNPRVKSLKSGMSGERFSIDSEDLKNDWNKSTSDLCEIGRSKLLGFWSARNYPLIGKKLIGAGWQPPNKFNIQVEPMEIPEEEINDIVSKKMKLRIIELNLKQGTVKKLNHFVRVPMCIGKINVDVISGKMRAFDIEGEHLVECWKALKDGAFPSNLEVNDHQMILC